jgi:hypothetical protein
MQISRKKMIRSEQKLNIAGVKFGIILIMTAICLAGCTGIAWGEGGCRKNHQWIYHGNEQ